MVYGDGRVQTQKSSFRNIEDSRTGVAKKKQATNRGQAGPAAGEKQPAGIRPEVVVAGIGASAGGLAALKTFFRNVGEDSGLAWVVVVHLSPDHAAVQHRGPG